MELPIYSVDAFTSKPFGGNPAAVCLLEQDISDELKQNIATELKLSETAFIIPINGSFSSANEFHLRWFTPTHEVNLCGHATLSAAAVLFKVINNENDKLSFKTLSGILTAKKTGTGITLDMPLNKPEYIDISAAESNIRQLMSETTCGLPIKEVLLSKTTKKLLLRLEDSVSMEDLEKINPSMKKMMTIYAGDDIMGVIVTVKGSADNNCISSSGVSYDFVSRYFAPWHGIDEDPVTGSAHTVLAGYWADQLKKDKFVAYQCSRRGGQLTLQIMNGSRLDVTGEAVIILRGTINV